MRLVDSHCHLPLLAQTDDGLDQIVRDAKNNGIEHILSVSIDLETYDDVLHTAIRYPEVSASVGVHPNCDKDSLEPNVDKLVQLGANEQVIAIGETGLDFFYQPFDKERQLRQFKNHIRAATELQKPIIIHCRDASSSLLPLLKKEKAERVGGIMHCFVDDWDVASEAMDMGFLISFSGIVTFKNAKELRTVAKKIPDENILVETDSPWLAPVPERGKKNQPSYVCHTAKFLSELRNENLDDFSLQTTRNFYSLFKFGDK